MTTIGERIVEARKEAGISQDRLAKSIGASKRAVGFWEAGQRDPKFKFVVRISYVTGKPLDFFADTVTWPLSKGLT